jgi:alkanesulfonate monooxygenase SsuD/methylene tetrahydromethanopterin reductase-like flavin-dependent oxidoreductase (luciferase family)
MVALGAHVGQQDMSFTEMRATWRRLDAAGLDWISAWDHIYESPPAGGTRPHFETVTTLAALCADTSRARVGCLVFYVGFRNPALLAKTAAALDHLSGGRFEMGLGAGWAEGEAFAYGYDFPPLGTRFDMLEEAFPLVRSLLTEERTTFAGRFYRVTDASNLPRPLQDRLPLWTGGTGERRTLRLAARHADGWNAPYISPAEFGRLQRALDRWCEAEGRDPASVRRTVNLSFAVSPDPGDAVRAEQRIREQWGDDADRVIGGTLLGTPEDAVGRILEYVAAGADGVNIALRAPWNEEALDAYLGEVVPAVRAAAG